MNICVGPCSSPLPCMLLSPVVTSATWCGEPCCAAVCWGIPVDSTACHPLPPHHQVGVAPRRWWPSLAATIIHWWLMVCPCTPLGWVHLPTSGPPVPWHALPIPHVPAPCCHPLSHYSTCHPMWSLAGTICQHVPRLATCHHVWYAGGGHCRRCGCHCCPNTVDGTWLWVGALEGYPFPKSSPFGDRAVGGGGRRGGGGVHSSNAVPCLCCAMACHPTMW